MDKVHDDGFMVFLRFDTRHGTTPLEAGEQPLASCSSYGEAKRIRLALQRAAAGDCVIRYVGQAGGGD
jgi:hypothetical protein